MSYISITAVVKLIIIIVHTTAVNAIFASAYLFMLVCPSSFHSYGTRVQAMDERPNQIYQVTVGSH